MKCDICKTSLNLKNIGYVRTLRGVREYECRRCHSQRHPKVKKLSGSWLLIT